ncbi:MAG TPA: peptide deformylase [Solirubrobacteraceae bacterium]|nr:peptide deformylase [Solirubrobacteraceae bacterium]
MPDDPIPVPSTSGKPSPLTAADADATFEVEPDEELVEESELDPETAARRAAALAHVRKFGDPVLRTRARAVQQFDRALSTEVARMGELMGDALGVGLAATQLGVLHRLLVYRVQQDAPVSALVNPEIEWAGRDLETMEEGCLSLPGVLVDVERPIHVRVRALDQRGERILVEASGLEARVIQHEIDHLDGVLILDRTSREQRKEAIRVLREAEQAA